MSPSTRRPRPLLWRRSALASVIFASVSFQHDRMMMKEAQLAVMPAQSTCLMPAQQDPLVTSWFDTWKQIAYARALDAEHVIKLGCVRLCSERGFIKSTRMLGVRSSVKTWRLKTAETCLLTLSSRYTAIPHLYPVNIFRTPDAL